VGSGGEAVVDFCASQVAARRSAEDDGIKGEHQRTCSIIQEIPGGYK
jgi:hypothetical protein